MDPYPKIQTLFMRGPDGRILRDHWAHPAFEYLRDRPWIMTEKIDGTNMRVKFTSEVGFQFDGKTDSAQLPSKLVQNLMAHFLPQRGSFAAKFPGGVCLYGEGYGAGIQKGGIYRQDMTVVVFDVKIDNWWLERPNVEDVASFAGLEVVPIVATGTLTDMIDLVSAGNLTTALSKLPADIPRPLAEGLVARPLVTLHDRKGERILGKLKTRDFLPGRGG
jgi:hypothetical protein